MVLLCKRRDKVKRTQNSCTVRPVFGDLFIAQEYIVAFTCTLYGWREWEGSTLQRTTRTFHVYAWVGTYFWETNNAGPAWGKQIRQKLKSYGRLDGLSSRSTQMIREGAFFWTWANDKYSKFSGTHGQLGTPVRPKERSSFFFLAHSKAVTGGPPQLSLRPIKSLPHVNVKMIL